LLRPPITRQEAIAATLPHMTTMEGVHALMDADVNMMRASPVRTPTWQPVRLSPEIGQPWGCTHDVKHMNQCELRLRLHGIGLTRALTPDDLRDIPGPPWSLLWTDELRALHHLGKASLCLCEHKSGAGSGKEPWLIVIASNAKFRVMLTHLNPPARHLLGDGPYPDEEKDIGLDLTAPDWRNGDRNYMKKLSPTDLYLCQLCTGEFLTVTSCVAHWRAVHEPYEFPRAKYNIDRRRRPFL
jgi:hypothetical protein